ncbi:response regulator transcription factor [Lentilitoribacter sp. Alg239-R112]|uniref:response regulator transcription factor n=1 Tax=Lentilitoribacter sp. Alg239-R112 TaxID=2305987 RepID=UPI0013A69AE5|nr:response regulator transcription factor [Lentilitoribacter sp. Alg239-R112]
MTDKIIVADDHPLFRDGISRIIRRIVPGKIVEVDDAKGLWEESKLQPPPTLFVLDLVFPGFEGDKSVAQLRRNYPQSAIIVITMNDEKETAQSIVNAGANGLISKSVTPDQMIGAINQILEGDLVICLQSEPEIETQNDISMSDLPQRQIDLLVRLGQGKTNKEIARDLDISPFTVRAHMSALFKSLSVTTRAAAASLATKHGLV